MPQKAKPPPSGTSLSTAQTAAPAACSAASQEPSLAIVSMSIMPPPRAESCSIESISASSCTRSSCSRSAAGASTSSRPSQSRSDMASSIASTRLALSG